MRFIGNKENLVDRIYHVIQEKNIKVKSFFDVFAGTANVGRYFKNKNIQIYSSDLLYFSYVLQQAYIVNNKEILFEKLLSKLDFTSRIFFASPLGLVIEYLNNLKPVEGFIYKHYCPSGSSELTQPRKYFSNENGKIIDSIRIQIENWYSDDLISKNEYYVLLACLIETVPYYANVSGVFAAFHKKWDPRAVKKLELRQIKTIINDKTNFSFNVNSVELLDIEADIYYLDPPYNQRQYAPNYHLLETIAKYDNPKIRGVTGIRAYENQKSKFCNKITALQELDKIAKHGLYKTLILSYNTEGIMPQQKIISILEKYGKLETVEFKYLRFKSNNNGLSKSKKYVNEQLFILRKHE